MCNPIATSITVLSVNILDCHVVMKDVMYIIGTYCQKQDNSAQGSSLETPDRSTTRRYVSLLNSPLSVEITVATISGTRWSELAAMLSGLLYR